MRCWCTDGELQSLFYWVYILHRRTLSLIKEKCLTYITLELGNCQQWSIPCSTMRVNWPPCSLKRKHIKLLSPVSVNVIWCWIRGPPAVLLLYCCSFSWRKMVICRGSVAPGQVSHSADAQAISLTPWEAEVMPDKGEWKGSVLWFITQ